MASMRGLPLYASLRSALAAAEALSDTQRDNILPVRTNTPGREADAFLDLRDHLKHRGNTRLRSV